MLQPRGASAPEVAEKFVVLIVEENAVFRSANAERLRAAGFEVLEAANSAEAEPILKSTPVDALFVPVRRRSRYPNAPLLLLHLLQLEPVRANPPLLRTVFPRMQFAPLGTNVVNAP